MTEEGPDSVSWLLARVMEKRLASLGSIIDPRLLAEALRRSTDGVRVNEKMGNLVLTSSVGKGDLTALVGRDWKISLSYYGRDEGGEVSVFYSEDRGDGNGANWYSQNLPDGSAAKILVNAQAEIPTTVRESAYVCRASHMFGGLLWDPSARHPAEVAYYPNGNVYWLHRYQNGLAKGRPGLPVFENYWEHGQLRIAEFGNDLLGKSRPIHEGPAYCEYYHNGQCAVEIYAERKWEEVRGRSILQPKWKARYFDPQGQRTTREVLMETKSLSGFMATDLRREMEDRGENVREEQIFLQRFTESIRLRDCVEPAPFFISPHPHQSPEAGKTTSQGLPRGNSHSPLFPSSGAKYI